MGVASARPQVLRVAAVWGTTVIAVRTLDRGESFVLGEGQLVPVPDGIDMPNAPLRAGQGGWDLDTRGTIGGLLRLRGRDEDPIAVARSGGPVAIMPGDFGVVQYGLFSIFFQYTNAGAQLTSHSTSTDLLTTLALFSSGILHVTLFLFARVFNTPDPLPKPLELTDPEEYAARFGLHRAQIEPPPPPMPSDGLENAGGSGVKDPGAQDKKRQGGGQKIAGAQGKLGVNGKADHTELQGEIKPTTSYGGLSEVLSGETGEQIKSTLQTINTVANALSGLNSQNIVLGGGPGTSLRGGGSGGGGTGAGVAFGSGTLNTGWGPGNGGGYGAGAGGPGGRGSGGNGRGGNGGGTGTGNGTGNGPGERQMAVAPGTGAARGGLSAEQIRRVVMAHVGALRACYESEAQRNPNLRGGVTVQWSIDPSGTVTSAGVAGTTLGNPRVEGCVVRQVKAWHFAASDSPSTIEGWPFKFGVNG